MRHFLFFEIHPEKLLIKLGKNVTQIQNILRSRKKSAKMYFFMTTVFYAQDMLALIYVEMSSETLKTHFPQNNIKQNFYRK